MPASIVIGGESVSPEFTNAVLRARQLAAQEAQQQQQMAMAMHSQRVQMQEQAMRRQAFEQQQKQDAEAQQWEQWKRQAEAVAYREGTPEQQRARAMQERTFTEGVRRFDTENALAKQRWEAEQMRAKTQEDWTRQKYEESERRRDHADRVAGDRAAQAQEKSEKAMRLQDIDSQLGRIQQELVIANQFGNVDPQEYIALLVRKNGLERMRHEVAYAPMATAGVPGVMGPPESGAGDWRGAQQAQTQPQQSAYDAAVQRKDALGALRALQAQRKQAEGAGEQREQPLSPLAAGYKLRREEKLAKEAEERQLKAEQKKESDLRRFENDTADLVTKNKAGLDTLLKLRGEMETKELPAARAEAILAKAPTWQEYNDEITKVERIAASDPIAAYRYVRDEYLPQLDTIVEARNSQGAPLINSVTKQPVKRMVRDGLQLAGVDVAGVESAMKDKMKELESRIPLDQLRALKFAGVAERAAALKKGDAPVMNAPGLDAPEPGSTPLSQTAERLHQMTNDQLREIVARLPNFGKGSKLDDSMNWPQEVRIANNILRMRSEQRRAARRAGR